MAVITNVFIAQAPDCLACNFVKRKFYFTEAIQEEMSESVSQKPNN